MGAGQFPAGFGPSGADPVVEPTAARAVTLPAALLLEGRTLDYTLDAAGLYTGLHPVDAWVANQLLIRRGTLASAPTAGQGLREVRRLGTPRAAAQARDLIQQALKERVDSGDITIVKIDIETSGLGRLLAAVSYVNNRLHPATASTTKVNLG